MGFLSKLFGQPSASARRVSSGEVKPARVEYPSWMGDRDKLTSFINGTQDLAAQHGVPKLFSAQIMSQKEIIDPLISLAASMERQGASFNDQQVAVGNKLIEFYRSAD